MIWSITLFNLQHKYRETWSKPNKHSSQKCGHLLLYLFLFTQFFRVIFFVFVFEMILHLSKSKKKKWIKLDCLFRTCLLEKYCSCVSFELRINLCGLGYVSCASFRIFSESSWWQNTFTTFLFYSESPNLTPIANKRPVVCIVV